MGKSATACKERYNKKAYDRITLRVKSGTKELLQQEAATCGDSLNEFIRKAIQEWYMNMSGEEIQL